MYSLNHNLFWQIGKCQIQHAGKGNSYEDVRMVKELLHHLHKP